MNNNRHRRSLPVAIVGGVLVAFTLIFGTIYSGHRARQDTEDAVTSVSLLYLDELAGRREQVVASSLKRHISDLQTAVSLMTEDDTSTPEKLMSYQSRMKKLYTLEKFAFIDTNGVIYTSRGTQNNIDEYNIDYKNISEPQIGLKDTLSPQKKVIVAIPVEGLSLEGNIFTVCFMEIDMNTMLEGVSLTSDNNGTTFVNIYTKDGVALTNMVLGGLAQEDNLLSALENADFEGSGSASSVKEDFANGRNGVATFTYEGIKETLSYTNVDGTDWMLTYLIRESVIGDKIGSVSEGIIVRSLVQTGLTVVILVLMFMVLYVQNKRAALLELDKERSEAENRVKQEELEHRLELQQRLLEQEKQRTQQDYMINALSSDYKSVYFADLETDRCICYRSVVDIDYGPQVGDEFSFRDAFTRYANERVSEKYRDGFLQFIDAENIRSSLAKSRILIYRYLIEYNGTESYEMIRIAGVHSGDETNEHTTQNAIGVSFTDIDAEMREQMSQNMALSDALNAAEEASRAKTAFLSSMSHEIRTPMNAIIGLDSIALNDPDISGSTREYLEKIGSSANHLLELINDILDMSRIESGKMVLRNEDFSFTRLMTQIDTLFSGQCMEKGLVYESSVGEGIADHYVGDSIKLKQILINILGNAVKFTPEGGKVSFRAEKTASFGKRSTLRFTISDTGVGIADDYLPHIFDPFSQEDSSATNKYGSSGLGLAITKNIVEMMNGNIKAESKKGEGTVFTVTVTLAASDLQEAGSEKDIDPGTMSVLVVDDDPVACEHAKVILEKVGIRCETATSGADAIDMVSLRHARQSLYDLILVDLKMPEMDGIETVRRIRRIVGRGSAIIIITAYKWDDVMDDAVDAGVDSFISKPLFADAVIEEFRKAVQKREVSPVPAADLAGKCVLLAEDVQINADIMKMVLAMRDMTADHVTNGREAVERFAESEPGHYSAILMDIRMPEMDGLEAASTIRSLDREDAKTVPIIALTANAFDEDVQRSLQAGMNAHLSKPIDNTALFATLESLIV